MTPYFKRLSNKWNELCQYDPLWAILTDENKKDGKWDKNEFFKTGEHEIDDIIKYINSFGLNINTERALDFGCGVGRLTLPLANYFKEVHGVDISQSYIDLADEYNDSKEKVLYHVNESYDLKLFPDYYFDFIYTNITLQHIKPSISKKYIKEFLRILSPGGMLIFQLPTPLKIRELGKINYTNLFNFLVQYSPRWLLDLYIPSIYFDMYGIEKKRVIKLLKENGAKIIDIKEDYWASPRHGYRYFITK